MLYYKEILSAIAIIITFVAFLPYIYSIFKGSTKPHVFSWVIWSITTIVVFFAQIKDGGGAGAWPIGISGSITAFIAVLAYLKRADIAITKTDWLFFIVALSSLPFWYLTSNPLWAVIILTVVDILGFGPTLRKAYAAPHSESLTFVILFTVRNIIVILALENYSITTILFPAAVAITCLLLVAIIMYRRRMITA